MYFSLDWCFLGDGEEVASRDRVPSVDFVGIKIIALGKSSATLGTRGFFDAVNAYSILSRVIC